MAVSPERAAAIEAAFDSKPAEATEADEVTTEPATTTDDDSEAPVGAPDTDIPSGSSPTDPTPEPAASAAPEAAEATPPAEPAAPAETRQRGPDGKFLTKDGKPAADLLAAIPPDADVVTTPVPESLKKSTREYVERVQGAAKEARTERDQLRGDFETLMEPIREAGATVEQFREGMKLIRFINSTDLAEQQQAVQMLQQTYTALAQRVGHVPAGVDPLQGQQDLLEAVQQNPQMRPWAEEVARARRLTQATQRQQQEASQRQQRSSAEQQAVQQGQEAVRAVEQTLEVTDPHYKAKVAALRADTAKIEQLRRLPPTEWASAFAQMYRQVPNPVAPATSGAQPGAHPQPIRAKTPAGASAPAKEPQTVGEAIRAMREKNRARA